VKRHLYNYWWVYWTVGYVMTCFVYVLTVSDSDARAMALFSAQIVWIAPMTVWAFCLHFPEFREVLGEIYKSHFHFFVKFLDRD